jgi:SAM-dependent methyltransferase
MDETSKTLFHHRRLFAPFLTGKGIDIGCGADPVVPSVTRWDMDQGDASRIDELVDGTFDYVWSSHCLEHMNNPRDALRRWWSLVVRGGHLILVVPDEDLYEQGFFPSRFNSDHKATFTVHKESSWSPVSVNLRDEFERLGGTIRLLTVQDDGLDHSLLASGPDEAQRLSKLFWTAIAMILKVVRADASLGMRVRRRRGLLIDQTLLGDRRLAQIAAVVQRCEVGPRDLAPE